MDDELGEDRVVAYTVGLSARDHPELMCTGLPADSAGWLLNQLGNRVHAGAVLRHGTVLDAGEPGEPHPVAIIDVEDDDELEVVEEIYGHRPALQVIYTDSTGRFPWHDGYANRPVDQDLRGQVPVHLLALPCPDVDPSPKAAEIAGLVITSQVVLDGAPVTVVVREADGAWLLLETDAQYEEPDDLHLVHIDHLIEADPSLTEVVDIPAGSRATRDSRHAPWVRWPLGSA
ncbi:DUF4262 domain-containing protein [Pseudokineococcus marinus]|uniref:DUF4262 domain-containing protein n=2 Tax=Pseudokineococcus marinus TaxID=351215 RepID=A0A849BJH7_9ACTN|nr:DUF4262 domain-containing protein [Pseudokineococcus marinus]